MKTENEENCEQEKNNNREAPLVFLWKTIDASESNENVHGFLIHVVHVSGKCKCSLSCCETREVDLWQVYNKINQKQIIQLQHSRLKIPTDRRQTSWLSTSMAEELNNSSKCWERDLNTSLPDFKSGAFITRPCCLPAVNEHSEKRRLNKKSVRCKHTDRLTAVEMVDELIQPLSWLHCNKHVMCVGTERYRHKLSSSSVVDTWLGSGEEKNLHKEGQYLLSFQSQENIEAKLAQYFHFWHYRVKWKLIT